MGIFSGASNKPPALLRYRSSDWFVLATVTLATFTDIFLYGVIVPVIPFALGSRSHVAPQNVQYWVSVLIAVYGTTLVAFSPVCGWFADRTSGRRLPMLIGLFALLGATVLLHVARNTSVLVVARVLQGLSAAVVWVVGLALLADTVEPNEIGKMMGSVGIAMSLGMLTSPLLGGIVFDRGGYNAVFAMCYALVGLDIIMRVALIEKKVAMRWLTPDSTPPGDVEAATPSALVAIADEKQTADISGTPPATDPDDDLPPLERAPSKRRYKLPPIIFLLSSRRLLASLWASLVQASLLSCFDSVVPIHVKTTFGWSSTGAGLVFLPVVIPTLAAPLVGWVSDRHGPRWPATAGFAVAAPLYACLRFVDRDGLGPKALLCALLALIGLAMTLCLPPLMAEITYVVVAKERRHPGLFAPAGAYAQAYGLFNMAFAGGCVVGPLWAGFVTESAGWATMGWSLGLFSFLTAFPTALWVGGSLFGEKKDGPESTAAVVAAPTQPTEDV